MKEFPSYPKVHTLGHREIQTILEGPVYLQEKIDGSQINFMWDDDGTLHVKSKGGFQLGGPDNRVDPDKMFGPAIDYLRELEPQEPWFTFRGEMITKPKQNTLLYERVPEGFLVLFNVLTTGWLSVSADLYDLPYEFVPLEGPYDGKTISIDLLQEFVSKPALLGGVREGVTIKNYNQFTRDGKMMVAKFVTDEFKEKHSKAWKKNNPGRADVLQVIIDNLNTEARFQKAVQHLAEEGSLTHAPQDIGPLMREVKQDTLDEEYEWITEQLIKAFMPIIERGIGRGLPEWYKTKLAESVLTSD